MYLIYLFFKLTPSPPHTQFQKKRERSLTPHHCQHFVCTVCSDNTLCFTDTITWKQQRSEAAQRSVHRHTHKTSASAQTGKPRSQNRACAQVENVRFFCFVFLCCSLWAAKQSLNKFAQCFKECIIPLKIFYFFLLSFLFALLKTPDLV